MPNQKTEMHKVTAETIERYKCDYILKLTNVGKTFPTYTQTCKEVRENIAPMSTDTLYNQARIAKLSLKESRNPSLHKLQESMIGYAIICTAKWFRFQPRKSSEDDFQTAIYKAYMAIQKFIGMVDTESLSPSEFEVYFYETVKLTIYTELESTYITRPTEIADDQTIASSNKVVEVLIDHEPVLGCDAFTIIDAYIGLTRPKMTVIEISKKISVSEDEMEEAIQALMSELKNIKF